MTRAGSRRESWASVLSGDRFALVARLTLIVTLVNGRDSVALLLLTAAVTTVVFLDPKRLRWPWPWFGLAAAFGWSQWVEWWVVDDHVVATTYWLVALGCVCLARDTDRALRLSARVLLGTIFAVAFGWKLLSSQYVSGEFWRYTLVRDPRIEWIALHVGGTDRADLIRGRAALAGLGEAPTAPERVEVAEGPRNRVLANVMTWWGLAVEGAIAALFLSPLGRRGQRARPVAVLVFCMTTYVLIPVVGFAGLLLTMTIAVTDEARVRALLIGAAALLMVWASLFDVILL